MNNQLKITERGWAGHFVCSNNCRYRRNTLIEYGEKRIVVSTVGNYRSSSSQDGKPEIIGCERYYETMAFEAHKKGVYWEADVSKQVSFDTNWSIDVCEQESDLVADTMHEAVVKELSETIQSQGRHMTPGCYAANLALDGF